jgi:hypothetical protein
MKQVLIRGPLLSMSGYGTHSRQIFRWLESQDVKITSQVTPWGMTPWHLDDKAQDGLIGRIMATAAPFSSTFDVSFQIQLPNEWDPDLASFNVGITAAVETDRCNPAWIQACNKMNKVIVPSTFTKSCLENTGKLSCEIEVIPEAFYDCLLDESNEVKLDLDLSTEFNFLIFGQITGHNPLSDRKNTFFMIKWLCEEFTNNQDVGIVIKTNHGKNSANDRMITSNMLDKLLHEVRQGPYPRIYLLHGALEQEEIQSVYQNPKIKALVAATRGEGYGLPLLEASAAGLPVMATNWSGHLDFMKNGKFVAFDYELEPVHESRIDGQIFMPGTKWAMVKEDDFKKRVRKFYTSPHKPEEWAKELSSEIRKTYSQSCINDLYSQSFNGIL